MVCSQPGLKSHSDMHLSRNTIRKILRTDSTTSVSDEPRMVGDVCVLGMTVALVVLMLLRKLPFAMARKVGVSIVDDRVAAPAARHARLMRALLVDRMRFL